MRREFCVLPAGFSEAQALNCKRGHSHYNLREVEAGEADKDIAYFDMHPRTKRARYIRVQKGFNSTRDWSPSAIPAGLAANAAGAYWQDKAGRGHFHDAKTLEERAAQKVEQHGPQVPLERVACDWITLEGVTWDERDIYFATPAPSTLGNVAHRLVLNAEEPDPAKWHVVNGYHLKRGDKPVRVAFHGRSPECFDRAADFYSKRWRQVAMGPAIPTLDWSTLPLALKRLDEVWSQILIAFDAGSWGAGLSLMPASVMPSALLHRALQAYLHAT